MFLVKREISADTLLSNRLASKPNSSSANNSGLSPVLPKEEPVVLVITSVPSTLKSLVLRLNTDAIGYPPGYVADVP